MPRTCTICNHNKRDEIDTLYIQGSPYRSIAKHFKLSESAAYRHIQHLPKTLLKAKEVKEIAKADSLLEQLEELQTRTNSVFKKAEKQKDLRTCLAAIREARGNLELIAKLVGELNEEKTINIHLNPEWIEIRTSILNALTPFPEARLALAEVLEVH